MLMVDIVLFSVIVVGSLQINNFSLRRVVVGFLSCAALISMFASPLFIIVSVYISHLIFCGWWVSLNCLLLTSYFFPQLCLFGRIW